MLTRYFGFLLIFACLSSANVSFAGDHFDNKTLGISVKKPASWVYATDAQNRENLARTKMADRDFQAYVVKNSRAPIFLVTKHPEPHDDLNASIKIAVRPAGRITEGRLKAVLNIILKSVAARVGKVERISKPKTMTISGYPAVYASLDYTLMNSAGQGFPTTSQTWLVLKGDLLFIIGAGMKQNATGKTRTEINSVISSIKLY